MQIDFYPPTPERIGIASRWCFRGFGCSALPFPYRVAVGAVCQIPGLALLGRGGQFYARVD